MRIESVLDQQPNKVVKWKQEPYGRMDTIIKLNCNFLIDERLVTLILHVREPFN